MRLQSDVFCFERRTNDLNQSQTDSHPFQNQSLPAKYWEIIPNTQPAKPNQPVEEDKSNTDPSHALMLSFSIVRRSCFVVLLSTRDRLSASTADGSSSAHDSGGNVEAAAGDNAAGSGILDLSRLGALAGVASSSAADGGGSGLDAGGL